jgi:hypothetical protein
LGRTIPNKPKGGMPNRMQRIKAIEILSTHKAGPNTSDVRVM